MSVRGGLPRGGPVTEQSEDGGYTLALMRLLVTGGAGFIGSNFVRYWVEQHPEDHVVAYDVLTYAGNRPNLADVEDAIVFVQGDICDGPLAEKTLRDEGIDTIVHFAAESHNSLAVLNPGLFFRTNVLGTQTLLEAARQAGIARFHHISTCEVYGDLRARYGRGLPGGLALSPPYALQRQQGRGGSCRAGLRRDLRPARHHHQLLQQLRPLSVSREGHPGVHDSGPRRQEPHPLRHHREPSGMAPCPRPLHRYRSGTRAWCRRGDLSRGEWYRGVHHGDRGSRAQDIGQAGVAQGDCARSPRARPPLPARLEQAPYPARMGPFGGLGGRVGRDGRVVRRQPLLVGAAPRRAPVVEGGWGSAG